MPLPSVTRRSIIPALLGRTARVLISAALLVLLTVTILVSPALLRYLDSGLDWSRLADIGQAYGPVSALLSALALCVVVLVQRRQLRQEQVLMAREMHASAMRTAMEDPVYGQCWGPRVAPDHMDERLFYYTNTILMAWLYAWECGDLSDDAVRAYVRAMADSEIPRQYWRMHGPWRLQSARGRRRRFLSLVDGEFRAATLAGPPSRTAEQPAGRHSAQEFAASCSCRRRRSRPQFGQSGARIRRMSPRH
jgi:hypothetical protein